MWIPPSSGFLPPSPPLHRTQGDHFSGWGQMERPPGTGRPRRVSGTLPRGTHLTLARAGRPAAWGAAALARARPPFLYEGVKLNQGKPGCGERSDRMPGRPPPYSSGMAPPTCWRLRVSGTSSQVRPRMAFPWAPGESLLPHPGRWSGASHPLLGH